MEYSDLALTPRDLPAVFLLALPMSRLLPFIFVAARMALVGSVAALVLLCSVAVVVVPQCCFHSNVVQGFRLGDQVPAPLRLQLVQARE